MGHVGKRRKGFVATVGVVVVGGDGRQFAENIGHGETGSTAVVRKSLASSFERSQLTVGGGRCHFGQHEAAPIATIVVVVAAQQQPALAARALGLTADAAVDHQPGAAAAAAAILVPGHHHPAYERPAQDTQPRGGEGGLVQEAVGDDREL